MLGRFKEAREELGKLHTETTGSIATRVQTVGPDGEVRVETFSGINGGGIDNKNALVTSNVRSRRERVRCISSAIIRLDKVITALEKLVMDPGGYQQYELDELIRSGAVPADIDHFLAELQSSIPTVGDHWEVISAPSTK
jgi:hypothetical protein